MEDVLLVDGPQSSTDLEGDRERSLGCQTPRSLSQAGEILPLDVLHRHVGDPVGLSEVVDPAHAGVVDAARQPSLVTESREGSRIVLVGLEEQLEGDGLPQTDVLGAIDLGHAAFAEPVRDPVAVGKNDAGQEALGSLGLEEM